MLSLSASGTRAETMAYGEAYDTLYQFGLTSHSAMAVGSAGRYGGQPIANLSGLSFTPDGDALYAVAGGMNSLARINPETGSASIVGLFGLAGQGDPHRNDALDLGMTFGCDGTLWLVSAYAGKLWTVDPANGATDLVGTTGHAITGLAAIGNLLYGAGGRGDNGFYRIDGATGEATRIGDFGDDRWINSVSMSFDASGTLWAVLNYVPPAPGSTAVPDWADLATINVTTGKLTIVGPITGPESLRQLGMKGFTIGPPRCAFGGAGPFPAPVGTPPWLFALAGLLVAAAAVALRRRALR
jgi:streptogramin lyase